MDTICTDVISIPTIIVLIIYKSCFVSQWVKMWLLCCKFCQKLYNETDLNIKVSMKKVPVYLSSLQIQIKMLN